LSRPRQADKPKPSQRPAPLAARSIGAYSKGCFAGSVSLPINGPDWPVMRLSRNRNWGTPQLLDYLEHLASDARARATILVHQSAKIAGSYFVALNTHGPRSRYPCSSGIHSLFHR
jgi:murein endopeptidase